MLTDSLKKVLIPLNSGLGLNPYMKSHAMINMSLNPFEFRAWFELLAHGKSVVLGES